jgi:hydrogenase maturation protein HypF
LQDRCVEVEVSGIVQGVGFRPFIARLASKYALTGFVKNSATGAFINICGTDSLVESFLCELQRDPPILAKIDKITIKETKYKKFNAFTVEESVDGSAKNALFPPDLTICEECEKELFRPDNRRFLYPLINCQNCGPRFTVIESLPYDRSRTTMRFFEMCEACKSEYKNISNRRFHAEPISCPDCGPSFYFADEQGGVLETSKTGIILEHVATALNDGKIVALKGVGGFHLLCRADSDEALIRLREKKRRAKKPLAVMFGSMEALKKECELSKYEENLVGSKERPITILKKSPTYSLSPFISHESAFIGAFLPYSGVYSILFCLIDFPLVATSANISDEPIITDEKELFARLGGAFDYAFYYDRAIVQGCDDSVVRAAGETTIKLRNSRGYAPSFFKTAPFSAPVFCAGAHQKNCFAIGFDDTVSVSSHIGDLGSLEASEYYEKSVEHMRSLWNLSFSLAVCDKNSRYASSTYAASLGVSLLKLQHHKAHFLASLFEKEMLHIDALGIVWDGTGLGDDGTVWGGEVFVKNGYEITRVAHLPQFWLLGGESVAKEPRKTALSLALSFLGEEESYAVATRLGFSEIETKLMFDAFAKKINCVKTTSMGRLFDGVAALIGVVRAECYEGESGLMMESLYDASSNEHFGELTDMAQLLRDILGEKDAAVAATKFINTLALYVKELSTKYDLPIFCSGGVFQNAALAGRIRQEIGAHKLFFHEKLSPNDSSVCVGQAAFASLYLNGHVTKEEL